MITCKKCKIKNKEGSKFCKKCGGRLTKDYKKQPSSKKVIEVEQAKRHAEWIRKWDKQMQRKLEKEEREAPIIEKRRKEIEELPKPKEETKEEKIEGGLLFYKNEKIKFLVLIRISLILIFGLAGIILLLNGKLESLVYLFISLIWTPAFSIKSKSLDRKSKIFISFMLLLLISPFQYETFSTLFIGFIFLVFITYIIKALKSKK